MTNPEAAPRTPEFDLADRCRKARTVADLSQQELADRTGISVRTITRYEKRATSNPSKLVLRQWAFACGVDYDWLRTGLIASGPEGLSDQDESPSACKAA